jgi:hypothetical protein
MKLNLRSTSVKSIVEYGSYVFYFTAAGVEAIDPVTRVTQAYADVANTTCGAVNSNGVYIGTTAGVYLLTHANIALLGNRTANAVQKYHTGSAPTIQSNAVNGLSGNGTALAIASNGGVAYLPDTATTTIRKFSGGASLKVALNYDRLAYEYGGNSYIIYIPISDWTYGEPIASATKPDYVTRTFASPGSNPFLNDNYATTGDTAVRTNHELAAWVKFNTSNGSPVETKVYKITNTTVTPVTLSPTQAITYGVSFASDGGFLAVMNRTGGSRLWIYKYNEASVRYDGINVTATVGDADIYGCGFFPGYVVTVRYTGSLTVYSIDTNGNLTWQSSAAVQPTGSGSSYMETIRTWRNYLVIATGNNKVALYQLSGNQLVFKHQITVEQSSERLSNISKDGLFAIPMSVYPWVALTKIDTASGTLVRTAYITNLPGHTHTHAWFHPSGGFLMTTWNQGRGSQPYTRVIKVDSGVGSYLFDYLWPTNYWGYSDYTNRNASVLLALDQCVMQSQMESPGGGWQTFSYSKVAVSPVGNTLRDLKITSRSIAFVATNAGVDVYNADTREHTRLNTIFGTVQDVRGISVTDDASKNTGLLSYGTANDANGGRFAVLNLRNSFTLVERAGDKTGPVWGSGLEIVAYNDEMERIEDAVSSTRKLVLLGTVIKAIVKHGANIYHFTEAGVDIHRIADGVRFCYASVANVTYGAVNDDGVYIGTSNAGVKKLSPAAIANGLDQTAAVTVAFSTATTPAIQGNNIIDMAGHGTALAISTAAGIDFLPNNTTVYKRTIAGACAVAMDATRFAYSEGNKAYFMGHPAADWVVGSATLVPNLLGTLVRAQKFGIDLFVATDNGITVLDTVSMGTASISAELGVIRNVISIHPTPLASRNTGLCAYGISYGDGTGKFGVIDMTTLV